VTPRISLSDIPSWAVKISRWRKDKLSLIQYIMVKDAKNDKGDNAMPNAESSMFTVQQVTTIDTITMSFYLQQDGKRQDSKAFRVSKTERR